MERCHKFTIRIKFRGETRQLSQGIFARFCALSNRFRVFLHRTLRRGMHDLHVWPDVEADGSHPSKTPGKTSDPEDKMSCLAKVGSLLSSFVFEN